MQTTTKTFNHKMNRHPEKLVAKAKRCKVAFSQTTANVIEVKSPSGGEYNVKVFWVDERAVEYACDCDFCAKWGNQDRMCCHKIAAEMALSNVASEYVSFWADVVDALRQHRIIVQAQDLLLTVRSK